MSISDEPLESGPPIGTEDVAPAVIYAASDRSGWLNGQVFGAQGTTFSLHNQPRVIWQVTTTGEHWALDDVLKKFDDAFRPAVDGTENFQEVVANRAAANAPDAAPAS